MASPTVQVKDGGGAYQATTNGVNVTPGNTTTINLVSGAGVTTWQISCISTDETSTAPTLTVDNVAKTATFTAPAAGKALIFRSVVNGGIGVDGVADSSLTTTFGIYTLIGGKRVVALNETFEGNATYGWTTVLNDLIRSAYAAFDPATLTLTGWWRANYGGSPWAGTASAGGSGSQSLSNANAPDVGGAVNGFTPADFVPANSDQLTSATAINSLVSEAAGSIVCLFYADAAFADGGAASYYNNPSFFAHQINGYLGLGFSTSGVRFGSFDTTSGSFNSIAVACATGGWHLAQARWNSTTLEVRVDGGSWSTLAKAVTLNTDGIRVGVSYNVTNFFDGKILELMTAQSRLSDANFDSIRSYMNARYGAGGVSV